MGKSLHQAMWRWHFYAGIIFAPFIIILALSGSVYLFDDEIESQQYRSLFYLNRSADSHIRLNQQLRTVKNAYPGYEVDSVQFERSELRTNEFVLRLKSGDAIETEEHHGHHEMGSARQADLKNWSSSTPMPVNSEPNNISVFLNPRTGQIQGVLDNASRIMPAIKKIHSELLVGGTVANHWVELSACWALILTVTGLYLCWPKGKFTLWGTFIPRLNRTRRGLWRDLHAATGIWVSLLLVVFILSGLSWAAIMEGRYRAFGKVFDRMTSSSVDSMYPRYAVRFGPKPKSDLKMKDLGKVPWAAEELAAPFSKPGILKPLSLQQVQNVAIAKEIAKPYAIFLPQGKDGVFTIATLDVKPRDQATINVDQYSGRLITDYSFKDYGWLGKAITIGISFHQGKLLGLPNQILGLAVAWGAIFLSISGWLMWLKRKPRGSLGVPASPVNPNASRLLAVCLIVAGLLLPPLGISLIVVYIFEKVVIKRIPKLRDYFAL